MGPLTKLRVRRAAMTAGAVGTVAITSTGCTPEEINNLITILRIIGWFI